MDEALRRARRAYLAGQDPVSAANYIVALERSAGLQAPHQYEIQNTLIVSSSHIDIDDSDLGLVRFGLHIHMAGSFGFPLQ